MKQNEIEKLIKKNFNLKKIPDFYEEDFYLERKQVISFFYGKQWDEISLKDFLEYDNNADVSALLSLLPLDYYMYYFKTFLIVSLKNCKQLGLLCDSIFYSFHLKFLDGTVNKLAKERLSLFSKEQLEVILQYFDYMEETYCGIVDDWGIEEARKSVIRTLDIKS